VLLVAFWEDHRREYVLVQTIRRVVVAVVVGRIHDAVKNIGLDLNVVFQAGVVQFAQDTGRRAVVPTVVVVVIVVVVEMVVVHDNRTFRFVEQTGYGFGLVKQSAIAFGQQW
jgi:hypothetical protein